MLTLTLLLNFNLIKLLKLQCTYVAHWGFFEEYYIVTYTEDGSCFQVGYNLTYNKKDNNMVLNLSEMKES